MRFWGLSGRFGFWGSGYLHILPRRIYCVLMGLFLRVHRSSYRVKNLTAQKNADIFVSSCIFEIRLIIVELIPAHVVRFVPVMPTDILRCPLKERTVEAAMRNFFAVFWLSEKFRILRE